MEKARNLWLWAEEGYRLFAMEGLDGIQIERLARILQRSKSGFYHYFGDLEVFCMELLRLHERRAKLYLAEVSTVKTIDPEYLDLVVRYKVTIMFHVQLLRARSPEFVSVAAMIDRQESLFLRPVWAEYLGLGHDPGLAMKYFDIVRDMFYARVSFKNYNYQFLHSVITEARALMQQFVDRRAVYETDALLR